MRGCFFLFILIILIAGCENSRQQNQINENSNIYATGFLVEKKDNYTRLAVFNPWEKAKNVSVEYFLVEKNKIIPDELAGKSVIRTPVERVICLSTTHLAFLDVLDETGAVTGISGRQYVSNPKIRKRMEQGEVPDVGYGQNLNFEVIVNQKPELVMVYGIGSEVTGYTQKIEELGIPVIIIAEHLEETPLGKTEWINFIAPLFDKEDKAGQYFSKVEQEYNEVRMKTLSAENKPKVLVGSPYKDSWWVPGGKSYLAHLITDAGGYYLGTGNNSHESFVISFENAFAWAGQADVWINMGNLASKKEILSADERFKNFRVFNHGKVYNNIKRLSSFGGNDFWESGTVNPHLILKDLTSIFHPELQESDLYYYQEIK